LQLAVGRRIIAKSCEVVLSECGFLRFGGARNIPIGGTKFGISCPEFSESTVVEASVFDFGILVRLPERPCNQKT
jgi:hypothetical protein